MKIGVTGTRNGINSLQYDAIYNFLSKISGEILHSDCIGADEQITHIGINLGYKIICYSPISNELRAHVVYDEIKTPKPYFARNRDIVNDCHHLIVAPRDNSPQKSGGTWYTYDFAVKTQKNFTVFYPNDNIFEWKYND